MKKCSPYFLVVTSALLIIIGLSLAYAFESSPEKLIKEIFADSIFLKKMPGNECGNNWISDDFYKKWDEFAKDKVGLWKNKPLKILFKNLEEKPLQKITPNLPDYIVESNKGCLSIDPHIAYKAYKSFKKKAKAEKVSANWFMLAKKSYYTKIDMNVCNIEFDLSFVDTEKDACYPEEEPKILSVQTYKDKNKRWRIKYEADWLIYNQNLHSMKFAKHANHGKTVSEDREYNEISLAIPSDSGMNPPQDYMWIYDTHRQFWSCRIDKNDNRFMLCYSVYEGNLKRNSDFYEDRYYFPVSNELEGISFYLFVNDQALLQD